VRGEPVSTATDIYSLGVILYELLTGQRPHGLTNYDPLEVVQKICETETIAPSRRGVPALRGDLDTIVLKAMQKDPARRYVSADQLSEDLRRYLAGLPVLARPDTIRYRVSKYARRNKWGLPR
jgi:serine/threonine protein kinase